MKITLKRTDDQLDLVRAMGSNDADKAFEAQAAVAELLGPIINQVVNNAVTVGNLFTTLEYEEDDNPSLPLDIYHDITDEDFINVYSQHVAGGLPYSQVFPAHNELKFNTYKIDSALAFDKKYARKARLDVVGKTFTRMAQEILLKQERTAFNVLATALIKGNGATNKRIISSNAAGSIVLDDLNRLITKSKRINGSFSGGTPVGGSKTGVTDLLVSPEMIQSIRAMAYNPINTTGGVKTTGAGSDTSTESALAAPESLRETLYNGAGLPVFYGINIQEVLELGIDQRFNKIAVAVDSAEGSNVTAGGQGGTPNNGFSATDELLIGIDRSRASLFRPAIVGEGGGTVSVMVDDQFTVRQSKVGYYAETEEGRLCIDDRALTGIAV